ncbi:hypothetical protein [Apibacter adventoris]|uniref:Uncharacterized protein n=1 Tax=Apibacter adventoris TaxID=1679466 RepID=A0A2S8ABG2_9FLAO|nr:hypothetical protein [Apibacter adventoris]PQL92060.1 hypothetical protein C4S77_06760 [Apibacter adventoris]
MKKYSLFTVLFSLLLSCNGQEKELIKPEEMYTTEKINIEKFDKNQRIIDTIKDGTIIEQNKSTYINTGKTEYTESITPPPPAMFCIYKIYYSNGNLKTKYTKMSIVGAYVPFGLVYHYDEKGKLIQKIDNDKIYNDVRVTPEILFDILDKEGIYIKKERLGGVLSINYHYDKSPENWSLFLPFKKGDTPFWEVTRNYYLHDGNQPFAKVYKIDALTGKVIPVYKYMLDRAGAPFELIPLQEVKKTSRVYKTYEGKDYTREEWEAFEQKQFEAYARKHNISIVKNDKKDTQGFTSRFLLDE